MKVRTLTAVLAVTTVFALSACKSSSEAGNAGHAPGGAPAATGSAQATASSAAPKNADVCVALPKAMAGQITGTAFTKTKSSSVQGIVFSCEYDGPGSALLQISVATQDGKAEFATDVSALKTVNHPPKLISGVGDEAFSEPNPKGNAGSVGASAFASYGAVFGDTYIKIGGLTYVTADQGRQIVEELHGKL